MRIGLVSCAAQKLDCPAPARDLYVSPLFRKASAYAEGTYDQWFILSAKYGLVHPNREIEPYDMTLNDMNRDERVAWANRVYWDCRDAGVVGEHVYFHAGTAYRERLGVLLLAHGEVEAPLAGLGIGQQLAWYKERGF